MENVSDLNEPFGKYILRRRLGVGGMAEVYLAEMIGPGGFARQAAVKRILPNLLQNEDFITAFVSEARLGGQLSHPNIVQTLELGQEGELLYLAMEYVDGLTLSSFLRVLRARKSPPPLSLALEITRQLCDGLAYAHSATDIRGVPLKMVHRDLKPANVLVSFHGQLKITDFGVARAESNLQHTVAVGQIKGTVSYMSPEQAMAGAVDHRSDLFSLGAILFELFTLEHLYVKAGGIEGLLQAQRCELNHRFPLLDPLPGSLKELIVALLQKDPGARPASAKGVRQVLQPLLSLFPPELEELETAIREAHLALPGLQPPKLSVRQMVEASIRGQLPSPASSPGSLPSGTFPPAPVRGASGGSVAPTPGGHPGASAVRPELRSAAPPQFKDTIDLRLSEIFAQSEVLSLVQDAPATPSHPRVQLWASEGNAQKAGDSAPESRAAQPVSGPVQQADSANLSAEAGILRSVPVPSPVSAPVSVPVPVPVPSAAHRGLVSAGPGHAMQEDEDDDFYRSFLRSLPGGQVQAEARAPDAPPVNAPPVNAPLVTAAPVNAPLVEAPLTTAPLVEAPSQSAGVSSSEQSSGEAEDAAGVTTYVATSVTGKSGYRVGLTPPPQEEVVPEAPGKSQGAEVAEPDAAVSLTGIQLHDLLDDARAEDMAPSTPTHSEEARGRFASHEGSLLAVEPLPASGFLRPSHSVLGEIEDAEGTSDPVGGLLDLDRDAPLEASLTGLQAATSLEDDEDEGATRQLPPGTHPLDLKELRVERMREGASTTSERVHPEWEERTDPGVAPGAAQALVEDDDDLEVLAQLGGLHAQLDEPAPASDGWSRVASTAPPSAEPDLPSPDVYGDLLDASEKTMMLPPSMGRQLSGPVSVVRDETRWPQEAGIRGTAQASLMAMPVQVPSTPPSAGPVGMAPDPGRMTSGTWSRQGLQQAGVLPPPGGGGVDGWTGRPGTGLHPLPYPAGTPGLHGGSGYGPQASDGQRPDGQRPGGGLAAPMPLPVVPSRPPTVHPSGLSIPMNPDVRATQGGPHTPPQGWGGPAAGPMQSVPPGFRAQPVPGAIPGSYAQGGPVPGGGASWSPGMGGAGAAPRTTFPQGVVPTPVQEITNPHFGAGGRPVPTPVQEITNPNFVHRARPSSSGPPSSGRANASKLPLILGAVALILVLGAILLVAVR